ncbi:MAG: bifunctional 3-hydroxydecanoyl-ACP dehydratase/trans-2-decenoyl-ACP isomerase [Spirochaetales bacterium]|nr:bifunctional 3-hydroxydecanoyl-ACP dehydratase/trans-2-decenoyl-ACP isomerase [Spirochaetales bacterium]
MKYQEFQERKHFTKEELLGFAWGTLVQDPPAEFSRLPAPPFLMVDRVLEVSKDGRKGRIVAEKDVRPDEWFFQCHFTADPVQPGCLGVDAIWQMIGFYICTCGVPGSGRALGCSEVEFIGQIRPFNKVVRYEIDIRRFTYMPEQGAAIAIGDGRLSVDGEQIYRVNGARVGVFTGIAYPDYPNRSANSVGGILERGGM